jgi:threonine/homoserine/homoserine lactone efflux protein
LIGVLLVVAAIGVAELISQRFPEAYRILRVAGYAVLALMLLMRLAVSYHRRRRNGS